MSERLFTEPKLIGLEIWLRTLYIAPIRVFTKGELLLACGILESMSAIRAADWASAML